MTKFILSLGALVVACCVPYAFADCRVVEYTMDDCPACVNALSDVGKLLERGVLIEVYNTTTDEDAAARAVEIGATKRPTFVVYDGSNEVARFEGAGQADKILNAIKSATAQTTDAQDAPEIIAPVINPDVIDAAAFELPPQTDFRTRPRVVDRFQNVGFLDKARDAWNGRDGGQKPENRRQDAPKVDRQNEQEQDARLGDRLSGKLLDGASDKLDEIKSAVLAKVGEEFDKTRGEISGEIDRVEKSVVSAIRVKIDEKLDALKTRVYYGLFFGAALVGVYWWTKKRGAK